MDESFFLFIDEAGNECTGYDYHENSAAVVTSDIFGSIKLFEKRAMVKKFLSPFKPAAILGIGLNYKNHAKETGMELPKHPILFMKTPASATGPFENIEIPLSCLEPLQVDYEIGLGGVIGKNAKAVSKALGGWRTQLLPKRCKS